MLATVAFAGVIVVFLGLALIAYASYVFDGRGRGLESAGRKKLLTSGRSAQQV